MKTFAAKYEPKHVARCMPSSRGCIRLSFAAFVYPAGGRALPAPVPLQSRSHARLRISRPTSSCAHARAL